MSEIISKKLVSEIKSLSSSTNLEKNAYLRRPHFKPNTKVLKPNEAIFNSNITLKNYVEKRLSNLSTEQYEKNNNNEDLNNLMKYKTCNSKNYLSSENLRSSRIYYKSNFSKNSMKAKKKNLNSSSEGINFNNSPFNIRNKISNDGNSHYKANIRLSQKNKFIANKTNNKLLNKANENKKIIKKFNTITNTKNNMNYVNDNNCYYVSIRFNNQNDNFYKTNNKENNKIYKTISKNNKFSSGSANSTAFSLRENCANANNSPTNFIHNGSYANINYSIHDFNDFQSKNESKKNVKLYSQQINLKKEESNSLFIKPFDSFNLNENDQLDKNNDILNDKINNDNNDISNNNDITKNNNINLSIQFNSMNNNKENKDLNQLYKSEEKNLLYENYVNKANDLQNKSKENKNYASLKNLHPNNLNRTNIINKDNLNITSEQYENEFNNENISHTQKTKINNKIAKINSKNKNKIKNNNTNNNNTNNNNTNNIINLITNENITKNHNDKFNNKKIMKKKSTKKNLVSRLKNENEKLKKELFFSKKTIKNLEVKIEELIDENSPNQMNECPIPTPYVKKYSNYASADFINIGNNSQNNQILNDQILFLKEPTQELTPPKPEEQKFKGIKINLLSDNLSSFKKENDNPIYLDNEHNNYKDIIIDKISDESNTSNKKSKFYEDQVPIENVI